MKVFDWLWPNRNAAGERPAIAIEVSSFDKGGLEKVVLDTAILLKQRQIVPLIVSVGTVGHLGQLARAAGIEVRELAAEGQERDYRRLLQERGVKLAISHFSRTGYPVFRRLGIPNITFIHNVYAMLQPDAVARFRADDAFVDRYISVSKNATRYAVERLTLRPDKIVTIPNGLIVDEHQSTSAHAPDITRARFAILQDDYLFLNVASYNLHKGHYLMLNALEAARRSNPSIKILCIGNEVYKPHAQALRQEVARRRLDGQFLMPGYFDDVAAFHAIADAFLLPSFIEGWSIAMNEAMFHQKPLILSDTGAAGEVIEDEDIGLIVPNEYGDLRNLDSALLDQLAYTPQSYKTEAILAEAMLRFSADADTWKEKGKLGREKILNDYNFSRIVDRYVDEIHRVIWR